MKEIIKSIKAQIKSCKASRQDLDDASWGYEKGILLSANEAQKILNHISSRVDADVIVKLAKDFTKTEDFRILKEAYGWELNMDDGHLWCLTAGDMGYERTNLKIDNSKFAE